jgi:hypothetical protein
MRWRVGYDKLKADIREFDALAIRIGFTYPRNSPLQGQMEMVKAFLADMDASSEEAIKKWMQAEFLSWYRAIIAVDMLCGSTTALASLPSGVLKKQLELSTMTDISQDFEQSQSKEYLYELYMAALFHRCGFQVDFAEPDLRISGGGLSQTLGVACKYVSSERKINDNISKGYEQIDRQGLPGFVAVGMDNVICSGMDRFIDFPPEPAEIVNSLGGELGKWIERIAKGRQGVQGRRPLDGAIFTLRMVGLWKKSLTPAGHLSFQLEQGNPIAVDFRCIYDAYGRSHVTDIA